MEWSFPVGQIHSIQGLDHNHMLDKISILELTAQLGD